MCIYIYSPARISTVGERGWVEVREHYEAESLTQDANSTALAQPNWSLTVVPTGRSLYLRVANCDKLESYYFTVALIQRNV